MTVPFVHLPCCQETVDRLSEFLDDELDEAARHEVALHLAICASCAELAADLEATVHALHDLRGGVLRAALHGSSHGGAGQG